MAKGRSLFGDPASQIQELTGVVKQDLAKLNADIAFLQEVCVCARVRVCCVCVCAQTCVCVCVSLCVCSSSIELPEVPTCNVLQVHFERIGNQCTVTVHMPTYVLSCTVLLYDQVCTIHACLYQ